LTSPGEIEWKCDGPIPRSSFWRGADFVKDITDAIDKEKYSLHLVPSATNFKAVDSILYARHEVLTCIQVTVAEHHPIAVSGLELLQSWLKSSTPLAPLSPSAYSPWRFIFIVPPDKVSTFKSQRLEGKDQDVVKWAGNIHQYVLGLDVLGEEKDV
jgi:hypothetical protein